jgi:hypothetical protein
MDKIIKRKNLFKNYYDKAMKHKELTKITPDFKPMKLDKRRKKQSVFKITRLEKPIIVHFE